MSTIDKRKQRILAVKADCDPRTILKALRGESVRGRAGERAVQALIEANLLPRPKAG